MSIPEFILRGLVVPNSLKPLKNGFSFILLNNLAQVRVTNFSLSVDGKLVTNDKITINMWDEKGILASSITSESPIFFTLGIPITVAINGLPLPNSNIYIYADTLEYGTLTIHPNLGKNHRPETLLKQISNLIKPIIAHAQARPKQIEDRLRPVYHFLPPNNWMNDPNGVIQWKGEYHLFYQHNPVQPIWGKIHWGHAVSTDLMHWRHLELAMIPSEDGPDKDGVWSGCTVNNGEKPVVFYTGVFPEAQCMATTDNDLLTLEKYPGNPVVPHPPSDMKLTGFRDPCVWKEGDTWYMIIGSGFEDLGAALLLYTSKNLIDWDYLHPLLTADRVGSSSIDLGVMWECPQMFPLGDQYLVHFSPCDQKGSYYVVYMTGQFHEKQFMPQKVLKLDYGNEFFYAPQAFLDEHGRRIMFGWCREDRSQDAQIQAGWAGVMSLPRIIEPRSDGLPGFRPADEVERLREDPFHLDNFTQKPDSTNPMESIQSDSFELQILFETGTADEVKINVCMSPDHKEYTRLSYFPKTGIFVVDTTQASLDLLAPGSIHEIPSVPYENGFLKLRLFVDRSILEVFLNGWACLTARMYPSLNSSKNMELVSIGGDIRVKVLDFWKINPPQ